MIKNNYFTGFIFFCRFTLLVCPQTSKTTGEKNILANLTNSQEPGVFGSLEPEPLEKKAGAGARAAWEKIRSRSRLKKKSGARAAKKFAGSPALLFPSASDPVISVNRDKLAMR